MDRSQEPFDRLESLGSSLTTDEGKGNLYSDPRTPNQPGGCSGNFQHFTVGGSGEPVVSIETKTPTYDISSADSREPSTDRSRQDEVGPRPERHPGDGVVGEGEIRESSGSPSDHGQNRRAEAGGVYRSEPCPVAEAIFTQARGGDPSEDVSIRSGVSLGPGAEDDRSQPPNIGAAGAWPAAAPGAWSSSESWLTPDNVGTAPILEGPQPSHNTQFSASSTSGHDVQSFGFSVPEGNDEAAHSGPSDAASCPPSIQRGPDFGGRCEGAVGGAVQPSEVYQEPVLRSVVECWCDTPASKILLLEVLN